MSTERPASPTTAVDATALGGGRARTVTPSPTGPRSATAHGDAARYGDAVADGDARRRRPRSVTGSAMPPGSRAAPDPGQEQQRPEDQRRRRRRPATRPSDDRQAWPHGRGGYQYERSGGVPPEPAATMPLRCPTSERSRALADPARPPDRARRDAPRGGPPHLHHARVAADPPAADSPAASAAVATDDAADHPAAARLGRPRRAEPVRGPEPGRHAGPDRGARASTCRWCRRPATDDYPLCNVAMWHRRPRTAGPGPRDLPLRPRPGTGCSCRCSTASKIQNGKKLIGMVVEVWTSDDQRFLYEITEVRRHQREPRRRRRRPTTSSSGSRRPRARRAPSGKLQVVAEPLSQEAADHAAAHPKPHPVDCTSPGWRLDPVDLAQDHGGDRAAIATDDRGDQPEPAGLAAAERGPRLAHAEDARRPRRSRRG